MDTPTKNAIDTIAAIDAILALTPEDAIYHTTVSVPGEVEDEPNAHTARPEIIPLTPALKGYFNARLKEIVAGDAISKTFAQFRIDQLATLGVE